MWATIIHAGITLNPHRKLPIQCQDQHREDALACGRFSIPSKLRPDRAWH